MKMPSPVVGSWRPDSEVAYSLRLFKDRGRFVIEETLNGRGTHVRAEIHPFYRSLDEHLLVGNTSSGEIVAIAHDQEEATQKAERYARNLAQICWDEAVKYKRQDFRNELD